MLLKIYKSQYFLDILPVYTRIVNRVELVSLYEKSPYILSGFDINLS